MSQEKTKIANEKLLSGKYKSPRILQKELLAEIQAERHEYHRIRQSYLHEIQRHNPNASKERLEALTLKVVREI